MGSKCWSFGQHGLDCDELQQLGIKDATFTSLYFLFDAPIGVRFTALLNILFSIEEGKRLATLRAGRRLVLATNHGVVVARLQAPNPKRRRLPVYADENAELTLPAVCLRLLAIR